MSAPDVQLDFGVAGVEPATFQGVRCIIIDGVRFAPIYLLALARSSGELFAAMRDGDEVVIHTIHVSVGGEGARLLVDPRPSFPG